LRLLRLAQAGGPVRFGRVVEDLEAGDLFVAHVDDPPRSPRAAWPSLGSPVRDDALDEDPILCAARAHLRRPSLEIHVLAVDDRRDLPQRLGSARVGPLGAKIRPADDFRFGVVEPGQRLDASGGVRLDRLVDHIAGRHGADFSQPFGWKRLQAGCTFPAVALRIYLEQRQAGSEGGGGQEPGGYGYKLRDEEGRFLGWDDSLLAESGVEVLSVAGTSFRLRALQDRAFAPGSRLLLRADPENEYDENAVEVLDADGRVHIGFVPKERSEAIARRLESEPLEVFSLWTWRNDRGQRSALRILVSRPGTVVGEPKPLV
jgi:hypothetical protein